MGVLVLNFDYLDTAVRSVSSEASEFPSSNLYDQVSRSLTWRSSGYFEVTALNNVLRFEETASTPLTATITEGEYAGDVAFFAAVKAALEDAGGSTYSVTRDALTKKIKIASDGMGGGGVFNLLWTDALTKAADLLGFDDSADDTGALTYTADTIRIHTAEWLKWDLGASSNPHAFVAVGKKGVALNLSTTAEIKLQGNLTDNWDTPAYSNDLSYDELAVVDLKDKAAQGLHGSALRYWRLVIVDKDNANGFIELSNVFLGESYSPPQGRAQFPWSSKLTDFSKSSRAEFGSLYSSRNGRTESFQLRWSNLTTVEKEAFDEIHLEFGVSKPFYLIQDSDTVYSTSVNYLTRFVRFDSEPSCELFRPGLWAANWSVTEEI